MLLRDAGNVPVPASRAVARRFLDVVIQFRAAVRGSLVSFAYAAGLMPFAPNRKAAACQIRSYRERFRSDGQTRAGQ